jgi:hypothetical protein
MHPMVDINIDKDYNIFHENNFDREYDNLKTKFQ